MSDLLQVTDLVKIYGRRDAATRALDGVSLSLAAGYMWVSWEPPAPARPPS